VSGLVDRHDATCEASLKCLLVSGAGIRKSPLNTFFLRYGPSRVLLPFDGTPPAFRVRYHIRDRLSKRSVTTRWVSSPRHNAAGTAVPPDYLSGLANPSAQRMRMSPGETRQQEPLHGMELA
jgi:hypothetical protein